MKNEYKNWREWILKRFDNDKLFNVDIDKSDMKYVISSTNSEIQTQITFLFMRPDDNETLYDIHFGGKDETKNNIWLSHFTTDSEYKSNSRKLATSLFINEKFIERLENEWLYIPLKKGWTEEVHYVGNKIYRAKLRKGGKETENWDINVKVPFDLKDFDYLKILLGIGKRKEQYKFKSIES